MLMQHNSHLLGMVAASILAVAPTDAFAQAKAGEQTPVTVNVTTAGTLNTLVTSDQKFTTTSRFPILPALWQGFSDKL